MSSDQESSFSGSSEGSARGPSFVSKLVAEFLGTFLLVFTVGCNVLMKNSIWAGVSIGSVLMVSIYALGGISGANFNPAVTWTLMVVRAMGHKGGLNLATGISYIVVQILGGIAGAYGYYYLFLYSAVRESFDLHPKDVYGPTTTGLAEATYTFMLCFVVLNVALAKSNTPNDFFGLAIGYVIVAGAPGAGAISGGCFNPAVTIGISALNFTWWSGFYSFCEILGALAAAILFAVVRPGEFGRKENLASRLVSEFLGTYMLVLTVGLNQMAKSASGAFSIAASLMSMIYALGNVSGAHFNPAVTLAILCSGKMDVGTATAYMLVQLAGGCAGGFTYFRIRHEKSFELGPAEGFNYWQVGAAEVAFTFVLAFVVLSVAVAASTKSLTMFGFIIGGCIAAGGNAIGGISGGSLNPAVSFGITTVHCANGGSFMPFVYYSSFELAGGLLAAIVFRVTHAYDFVLFRNSYDDLGEALRDAGKMEGSE